MLARALKNSVEETCLCARQGGDEFQLLVPDCDGQAAAQILEKVQKYLDNYNRLHTKEYLVQASGGYSARVPQSPAELSEMFREADREMYRMKQKHQEASALK